MSFISLKYILFLFACILINYIIQKKENDRLMLISLLVMNIIFYASWNYRFLLLLFSLIVITYYCSLKIDNTIFYIIGILTPVVVLCFFKYFNFFLDSLNLNNFNIVIPVGISFYTFESMSYIIDVKRGKIKPEKDILTYAVFLSFFPNISSGPIERSHNLLNQFKENKKINRTNIEQGIQIMAIGYFKKIVIADRLAVFVNDIYNAPKVYNSLTIFLAVLSYSIQIYMDFSGYSDIAIGSAKCLGYDLKNNFNLPYVSKNITEFWRRWHISLSSWFKDYVYIPLGGNKKGKLRQYINLIIVMTLSGLWHGANWSFIIWGFINGIILCIEKNITLKKSKNRYVEILKIIKTYILISFTWIFFRADSFFDACTIIKCIFSFKNGISQPFIWSFVYGFIFVVLTFISSKNKDKGCNYIIQDLSTIKGLTIFLTLIGMILILANANTNPFVYLKF